MLPCLNCKKQVSQMEICFFLGVYCCPECYKLAEHAYRRIVEELARLRSLAREAVRMALSEGRLSPAAAGAERRDVLMTALQLEEELGKFWLRGRTKEWPTNSIASHQPTGLSTESTEPSAPMQAVLDSESSTKPNPQD